MTKVKKSSELLWLMGVIFVALGVSICSYADLGVSMIAAPAFIIFDAVKGLWSGFSVGMIEYIFQGLLLIILCILIRKFNWRFLLAFLVAFIYGYTLNLFLWILSFLPVNSILQRWIMLLIGDVVTAFGVACFFKTYMPLQVYELFVAKIASTFKLTIAKTKWGFDVTLLITSIILALTLFGDVTTFDWSSIYYKSFHSIGLGTLVTTIINSPIISFMSKFIDKTFENTPLLPKLENFLNK